MAKGYPGFPMGGNMNNMMKQVQKLQKQMEEMQENLKNQEIEFSAGGGAVVAKVNGSKELVSITLDKEVVDPDDVEMLQDLIITAVNGAIASVEEKSNSAMNKITGGLNIPGL
ncbi:MULTISPECIES: YbaB/EbfC family nucleoid-associated protein [Peptoniphilus]|uniref:YbaB/EbfC family nucleoid-associated protein n=1 Tax=Peptoniphilus TaxID=162289 RepID=UPI0001DAA42B|nr:MULTISPECIES: YbaB/EbfC family nucleoid-associated protein [Peptoniphilus]EFI41337.1 DNA-binding protein, YbaB/EbfC family [Peptoniphilus sp. oral taxon 386 str. F0131]